MLPSLKKTPLLNGIVISTIYYGDEFETMAVGLPVNWCPDIERTESKEDAFRAHDGMVNKYIRKGGDN